MTEAAARFPLLDSLRALAAFGVLFGHALYEPAIAADVASGAWRFGQHLQISVPVFFGLSGFLLHRPFVASRAGGPSVPVKAYAWRRLLRIVPAYWVALTVVTIWFGLEVVKDEPLRYYGFAQIYENRTFFFAIGQAWSLCDEVVYYVMLPVLAFALRPLVRRRGGWKLRDELGLAIGIVLVGVVWNIAALTQVDPITKDSRLLLLGPLGQIHFFAIGMVLAVLSVWIRERADDPRAAAAGRFLVRVPGGTWWLGALGALGVAVIVGPDGSLSVPPSDRSYLAYQACYGVAVFALLAPAVFGDPDAGRVRRALGWRPLVWAGAISYSIYLYHFAVYSQQVRSIGVARDGAALVGMALLAVVLTIAVAAASYYAVERPAMRLRRKVTGKPYGIAGEGKAEIATTVPVQADREAPRSP